MKSQEAAYAAKFQKMFRQRNPDMVLIKHRDTSMVGCPDASVTGNGRVVWLEYKFDYLKPWMEKGLGSELAQRLLTQHSKGAEAQRSMMDRLGKASASLYMMWVHKTACYVIDPVTQQYWRHTSMEGLCERVEEKLRGGLKQVDFVGL